MTAGPAGGCFLDIAPERPEASIGVAPACGPSAAARVLDKLSRFVTSLRAEAESEAPG